MKPLPSLLGLLSLPLLLALGACARPASPPVDSAPARSETAAETTGRATVRAELARHRAQQLERLEAYAAAGQFPHDLEVAPSLHMFKDAGGRLCAVANLVHQDGRDDLVDATVRDRNDLAIADVSGGPMLDWVLASGLTQEELARIQLPAPVVRQAPPRRPTLDVARKSPPGAIEEATMTAVVRAHLAEVESQLRATEAHSLDVAAERYAASHGPHA